MVTNKTPTVAEANDIANSLLDGVHGLVLAAETAIGVDPPATVELVRRAIGAFEGAIESHVLDQVPSEMHLVA
jgi:pyruvate kinase